MENKDRYWVYLDLETGELFCWFARSRKGEIFDLAWLNRNAVQCLGEL